MNNIKIQKQFYDKAFTKVHVWQDADFPASSRYLHNRFLNLIVKKDTKNILEIGCGNGLLTFFLLKKPIQVTAVDISGKAIENIQIQFKEEVKNGKLKPVTEDVLDFLRKTGEKFDAIVGSGIIHHIPKEKWDELFQLAYKKLNPGGIFACAPEPNASGLYSIAWRLARYAYKLFNIEYDSEVEKGTFSMLPSKINATLLRANFSKVEILPFQSIPYFHLSILAYFDRLISDRLSGRLAMYIIIKGEKSLNADQTIM